MDPKKATTELPDYASTEQDIRDGPGESIEERCFTAALICLEGHYTQSPIMGPLTIAKVNTLIAKTLEKTHTCRKSREALSRNVAIWIWLTRIFAAAIPSLTTRSVGPLSSLNDPEKGVSPQESTALIVMNHCSIKEDINTLVKLMHIARNLLVNAEPEVPQDICAAVHFDQMVYQTIILCVNVASKGYDGEILDEPQRQKLTETTEHYKKLLVTSLQQAHNWTAKHDRNKMSFWFDVLFDDDGAYSGSEDDFGDNDGFRPDVAKQQTQHWLDRNSKMCDTARKLLREYVENHADKPPGNLAPIRPLAWNWLPDGMLPGDLEPKPQDSEEKTDPTWDADVTDKFEQDRIYGRVSREIDTWWLRARDPNYERNVMSMPAVDVAQTRLEYCKNSITARYSSSFRGDQSPTSVMAEADFSDYEHCPDCHECHHDHDTDVEDDHEHNHDHDHDHNHDFEHDHHHSHDHDHDDHDADCPNNHHNHQDHHLHHHHHHQHDYTHDYVDEADEDAEDDDVSYGDGPLTGLLTEIPNILDPKQIEALHMIVKSCILDSSGSGPTRAGENLQKTRCRMFMALDCGRSLLREMLVFIAVWEKEEQSLIFQVTSQIVDAIHNSALIPYAWNCLRIPKDIVSPAQTVLLRLVNHMFRTRTNNASAGQGAKESDPKDIKLVNFFFSFFRTRIVPECAALMHMQTQIREGQCDPAEFPVDHWDMERARDGLTQYLDFIITIAEIPDTRQELIGWEAVYDLLVILSGLESAVPKKPFVELPKKSQPDPMVERPYASRVPSPPPPPPLQDPAYKLPWAGIKGQVLTILGLLLQPPQGQSSPGNPDVQMQIVRWDGIVPLLNSSAYDDHNPFAKERVTLCLKYLLDGCEKANAFFRDLANMAPPPNLKPPAGGSVTANVRLDGVLGDVKLQVQSSTAPGVAPKPSTQGEDPNDIVKQRMDMIQEHTREVLKNSASNGATSNSAVSTEDINEIVKQRMEQVIQEQHREVLKNAAQNGHHSPGVAASKLARPAAPSDNTKKPAQQKREQVVQEQNHLKSTKAPIHDVLTTDPPKGKGSASKGKENSSQGKETSAKGKPQQRMEGIDFTSMKALARGQEVNGTAMRQLQHQLFSAPSEAELQRIAMEVAAAGQTMGLSGAASSPAKAKAPKGKGKVAAATEIEFAIHAHHQDVLRAVTAKDNPHKTHGAFDRVVQEQIFKASQGAWEKVMRETDPELQRAEFLRASQELWETAMRDPNPDSSKSTKDGGGNVSQAKLETSIQKHNQEMLRLAKQSFNIEEDFMA